MNNDKIQPIGVKKGALEIANRIHYGCRPSDWQMFEILVSFCKDCPDEFTKWKDEKLEIIEGRWKKKIKKLKK